MWCPVDIQDHEQGHVTKRVCACMGVRARVRCDFVLLELLTLVASRNTTPTFCQGLDGIS